MGDLNEIIDIGKGIVQLTRDGHMVELPLDPD